VKKQDCGNYYQLLVSVEKLENQNEGLAKQPTQASSLARLLDLPILPEAGHQDSLSIGN